MYEVKSKGARTGARRVYMGKPEGAPGWVRIPLRTYKALIKNGAIVREEAKS